VNSSIFSVPYAVASLSRRDRITPSVNGSLTIVDHLWRSACFAPAESVKANSAQVEGAKFPVCRYGLHDSGIARVRWKKYFPLGFPASRKQQAEHWRVRRAATAALIYLSHLARQVFRRCRHCGALYARCDRVAAAPCVFRQARPPCASTIGEKALSSVCLTDATLEGNVSSAVLLGSTSSEAHKFTREQNK